MPLVAVSITFQAAMWCMCVLGPDYCSLAAVPVP